MLKLSLLSARAREAGDLKTMYAAHRAWKRTSSSRSRPDLPDPPVARPGKNGNSTTAAENHRQLSQVVSARTSRAAPPLTQILTIIRQDPFELALAALFNRRFFRANNDERKPALQEFAVAYGYDRDTRRANRRGRRRAQAMGTPFVAAVARLGRDRYRLGLWLACLRRYALPEAFIWMDVRR